MWAGSLSEEIINRLQNGDFQLPFGNDVALPAPVSTLLYVRVA